MRRLWGRWISISWDDESNVGPYLSKLQEIYLIFPDNLLGLEDRAKSIDINIAILKDRLDESDGDDVNVAVNASTLLQGARDHYEFALKTHGSTTEATLQSGSTYATELFQAHRGIEAERLIVKLAASNRHVHGPEHSCSTSLDEKVKNASHAT